MATHNRYRVILGSMSQIPVTPLNQPQVQQIPGNPPGLETRRSLQPGRRSLKAGKVLGAIQILSGLIHISLGIIMATIMSGPYTAFSFYGGYPFWGGIMFIISGSLSVESEKLPRFPCLLKISLGLNIASAICSMVGILLLITDMIINSLNKYKEPYHYSVDFGVSTSAVMFTFSLLECCIACVSAHFGCKLICYSRNKGTVVFQTVYVTHPVADPEPVTYPVADLEPVPYPVVDPEPVNSSPSYSSED